MRSIFPAFQHRMLLTVLVGAIAISVITLAAVLMQRGEDEPALAAPQVGPPVFVTGGTPSQ